MKYPKSKTGFKMQVQFLRQAIREWRDFLHEIITEYDKKIQNLLTQREKRVQKILKLIGDLVNQDIELCKEYKERYSENL